METSDSEYFESADEDLESDYEESKKHQSVRHNINHKVIESEVGKLKLHGKQGNRDESEQKNKESKLGELDKLIPEINVDNTERTIIPNLNFSQDKNDESAHAIENLNPSKDILKHNKGLIEELSKVGHNFEGLTSSNEATIKRSSLRLLESSENKIKAVEIKQRSLEPEKIKDQEEGANLWDDDEIDWGSEAAKEESQKTELSPISKNEDSGWDDFDAEWESESPLSKPKDIPSDNKSIKIEKTVKTIEKSLWDDDDDGWEPVEKPPDEKSKENESNWGGWSGWGVSSLLNTATQSVSSLTTHVSQGLSTVLENSIGIPDPEEMARISKLHTEKEILKETDKSHEKSQDSSPATPVGFGLGNLVSGVSQLTRFVETTGTKVISGGLDTLEAIGKKTVEVLQEGDPGLKKKRAFLKLDAGKPNLSQILREAKERAEEENEELAQRHIKIRRVKNYETLFDDHQGLVHLEALEMLSKLCNIKLDNLNRSLSGEALTDMQETLEQVKELCELSEEEEDEKVTLDVAKETISNAVKEIGIPISYERFFSVCDETDTWLKNINLNFIDSVELHCQAIDTLAQLTALAVEQFHKSAELLLVKEHRSTADEADSLVQITTTIKLVLLSKAAEFTEKFNCIEKLDKHKISEYITNIFYEAANSGTYIQDAFQLLMPVLQVGAV